MARHRQRAATVEAHLDEHGPPETNWIWQPLDEPWPRINGAILATPADAICRAATLSRELAWQSRTGRHPSADQVHEGIELLTLLNALLAQLWPITDDDLRKYCDRLSRHWPRGRLS